ncbi:MAG TPA: quinone-dependent dihydroorotate dehydrogenase [Ignavibacteria bacterium]|nr:quinone-dependent dihydroorotate dehydrogenase [Ignavibacteria bacterium]HMR39522.1 quinone-dependent dihydroorotate dehydrogenase [Ignavibacteria bacterium]
MLYKKFIRKILFLFDAETIHNFTLKIFSKVTFLYPILKLMFSPEADPVIKIKGLKFKNRLGLAAGFDKNGIAIRFWETIGFSHLEVGTVTPLPQPGNPKPRIFRLKEDEAIINRLGFNNKGADEVRRNILEARKSTDKDFIIGVNIGKNKNTPVKDAVTDYKKCFEILYDAADYFTINVSSPNTEGLRLLQEEKYLDELLSEINGLNELLSGSNGEQLKPVFLKIAPDLSPEMTGLIYKLVTKNKLSGIIATNTTVERVNLKSRINEQGGLSGKPLKQMSDKVLRNLNEINKENSVDPVFLIAVGGVFDKNDFQNKLNNGASLVQIYTGFIYEGPSVLKKILN